MRISRRRAVSSLAIGSLGAALRSASAGPLAPGLCAARSVAGFDPFCFIDSDSRRHQVYVADGGGPPVLLLHELPGLVDADLCAASRLAAAGFTVVAPLLFGEPGGKGHWIRAAFTRCGKDEFSCNSGERTSPVVSWLRELAVDVRRQWPAGNGVGVIGMCLTGAFPLAMLREDVVVAPVLCQPTLPFTIWNPTARWGWFRDETALAVSVDDLADARDRRNVPILGLRYGGDWRCPQERFDRLKEEFGARFDSLVLDGKHHSTLGSDFCDVALRRVLTFLRQQLVPATARGDKAEAAVVRTTCPSTPSPCGALPHHGELE